MIIYWSFAFFFLIYIVQFTNSSSCESHKNCSSCTSTKNCIWNRKIEGCQSFDSVNDNTDDDFIIFSNGCDCFYETCSKCIHNNNYWFDKGSDWVNQDSNELDKNITKVLLHKGVCLKDDYGKRENNYDCKNHHRLDCEIGDKEIGWLIAISIVVGITAFLLLFLNILVPLYCCINNKSRIKQLFWHRGEETDQLIPKKKNTTN